MNRGWVGAYERGSAVWGPRGERRTDLRHSGSGIRVHDGASGAGHSLPGMMSHSIGVPTHIFTGITLVKIIGSKTITSVETFPYNDLYDNTKKYFSILSQLYINPTTLIIYLF